VSKDNSVVGWFLRPAIPFQGRGINGIGAKKKVKKTTQSPFDVPQTIKVQRRGGCSWNQSLLHLDSLVLLRVEGQVSGSKRLTSA
jgi:hypothetical protein